MTFDADHPPLEVDPRPRRLLERYASLVGGMVMELAADLLQLELPRAESVRLGHPERLLVALSPTALDEEPAAEILVVGSALLAKLVDVIRERGSLDDRGLIPPTVNATPEAAVFNVPLENAEVSLPALQLAMIPVGRLLARITIRSGPSLAERLVESSIVDLSLGVPVPSDVAAVCDSATSGAASPSSPADTPHAAARPMQELLPVLFADLEARLEQDLTRVRDEAARARAAELARLNAYYERLLEEVDPDDDPIAVVERKSAIRADQARRQDEEVHRFDVRVTVHPVQLISWSLMAQRASWTISAASGAIGTISAKRLLAGDATWELRCPHCGILPTLIRVCSDGHVVCGSCSVRCGVCRGAGCADHGATTCEVEGHAVCGRHSATCPSCRKAHCTTHSARCVAQDHLVCTSCLVHCARCGNEVCGTHGVRTAEGAPRGQRWLCTACTVFCEAGSNEPVGLDEAERCASCERFICTNHAARCLVDQRLHCSRHLRRSDHSGRLTCEAHRAACADEPHSLLASDEVTACASCARVVCGNHSGTCGVDGQQHCSSHLMPLRDKPGERACEQHRSICAIDGVAFSLTGTRSCPICSKYVCEAHLGNCRSCARVTCRADLEDATCRTCARLEVTADPEEALITASLEANRGEPAKAKVWRTARDAAHTIVELELGWRRRLVFAVPIGESRPKTVVFHGLLGAERRR